jgi:predicted RND superfamily exporter protein
MALLTLLLASGVTRIRVETSTESYLDPRDPERARYDAFRRQFANDDTILLLLESERVFSFPFLEHLRRLHRDLENEVPLVDEVTSLVNARVTRGSERELIVEELLGRWPADEAELRAVEARARANPVYRNTLLSEDGRCVAIAVTVAPTGGLAPLEGLGGFDAPEAAGRAAPGPGRVPILEGDELILVMEAVQEIVARHGRPDLPIHVTGNPEMSYASMLSARSDATRFAGVSLLVIAGLLLVVFRRVSGVLIPLLVVTLPLAATLGIMGYARLPITLSTQQLPTFLLVVGVADSVHLLTVFYRLLDAGSSRRDALAGALGHSGLAVVMTSVTTAGGLGSLAFADLAPVAGLGVAAPTGVLLALLYSLVLLPALVALLPIRPRRARAPGQPSGAVDRGLAALGDLSTRRPGLVVAAWTVTVIAAAASAAQLRLSHEPLKWFPADHPSRVAAEVANREMRGLMPLELLFDTGRENGLHDPETLARLERIQEFARGVELEGMRPGSAISVIDVLKETHRALNENDPAYYVVPRQRDVIAQELLLFESSGSDDLEELVDAPFRTARVSLLVNYEDGLKYLPLIRELESGAREIAEDHATIETSGLVKLWLRTITAMLSTTARSYLIALLVIAPILVVLIGELRLGLLSLVPNLAPIVLGMGLMQALGMGFDSFTMTIGTIAIGVAVDDTIHVMHGVRRELRRGADAAGAVRATLLTTGRALLTTTVALSAGFFVQMTGTLSSVRNVGLITGFTLVAALLADLTLSPALVALAARRRARLGPR